MDIYFEPEMPFPWAGTDRPVFRHGTPRPRRGRVASSPLPKSQGPQVQLQLEITLTLPGFVVA